MPSRRWTRVLCASFRLSCFRCGGGGWVRWTTGVRAQIPRPGAGPRQPRGPAQPLTPVPRPPVPGRRWRLEAPPRGPGVRTRRKPGRRPGPCARREWLRDRWRRVGSAPPCGGRGAGAEVRHPLGSQAVYDPATPVPSAGNRREDHALRYRRLRTVLSAGLTRDKRSV